MSKEATTTTTPVEPWTCETCGRDFNAGPLVDTGHTVDPIPDNRVGARLTGEVRTDGRFRAICRWCTAEQAQPKRKGIVHFDDMGPENIVTNSNRGRGRV
jgi:hypothetical protein